MLHSLFQMPTASQLNTGVKGRRVRHQLLRLWCHRLRLYQHTPQGGTTGVGLAISGACSSTPPGCCGRSRQHTTRLRWIRRQHATRLRQAAGMAQRHVRGGLTQHALM